MQSAKYREVHLRRMFREKTRKEHEKSGTRHYFGRQNSVFSLAKSSDT